MRALQQSAKCKKPRLPSLVPHASAPQTLFYYHVSIRFYYVDIVLLYDFAQSGFCCLVWHATQSQSSLRIALLHVTARGGSRALDTWSFDQSREADMVKGWEWTKQRFVAKQGMQGNSKLYL